MTGRGNGYHVDFEMTRAHQAAMREARDQERLARRVTEEQPHARISRYGVTVRRLADYLRNASRAVPAAGASTKLPLDGA